MPKCADGAEVYLQLRILLNQADKGQFQQLLTQFLSYVLSHNLNRFHAYFTTYYCSRIAVCIHATVCKHCHIAHMENIREEPGLFQCDMESFLEQVAEDGDEQHEQEEEPDKRQDEVDDQLEEGDRELEDADVQLEEGDRELEEGDRELGGDRELEDADVQLEEGDRELEEGDRELEEGDRELGEGDRELKDTDKQPEEGDKQQAQLNCTLAM